MIVLGIDPGTASMGYGVLNLEGTVVSLKEHGVIKTNSDLEMPKRLGLLYAHLDDVAKKFLPKMIVIESLFFNTNTKTAMTVGQARGVSMLVAAHNNVEVMEYTALQAKRALTGYGRADKKQMQEAVKDILGLSAIIKSDDANDGVAMALCYYKLGHKH